MNSVRVDYSKVLDELTSVCCKEDNRIDEIARLLINNQQLQHQINEVSTSFA
jgi:hypothetical protein